jgi:hypothetical protein
MPMRAVSSRPIRAFRSAGPSAAGRRGRPACAALAAILAFGQCEASAAALFESRVELTATLSLSNGAPLSALGYAFSDSFYSVSTAVGVPGGGLRILSDTVWVERLAVPAIPYDQLPQGDIARQIFNDTNNVGMNYPGVSDSAQTAFANARGTPSGSGASFTMSTLVSGGAYPEAGYAAASLGWEAKTVFQNLTSTALDLVWALNYSLTASASVGNRVRESATVESHIVAEIGSAPATCDKPPCLLAFIAAADPPLAPPVSAVPISPNPRPVSDTKTFRVTLAPGAFDSFTVSIVQFGSAVVPAPPALPLFVVGLAALAVAVRRRATADAPLRPVA